MMIVIFFVLLFLFCSGLTPPLVVKLCHSPDAKLKNQSNLGIKQPIVVHTAVVINNLPEKGNNQVAQHLDFSLNQYFQL